MPADEPAARSAVEVLADLARRLEGCTPTPQTSKRNRAAGSGTDNKS